MPGNCPCAQSRNSAWWIRTVRGLRQVAYTILAHSPPPEDAGNGRRDGGNKPSLATCLGLVDVAPPSRGSSNLLYIYQAAVYKGRPGLPVMRSRNVALSDQVFFQSASKAILDSLDALPKDRMLPVWLRAQFLGLQDGLLPVVVCQHK